MNIHKTLLILALSSLPIISLAAEMGTALKDDSIRAEPYTDAKLTGKFTRGDKLEILAKQGGWLKVKTTKNTGWVRLLSVRRTSTSSGSTKGILDVASGRAGTGQVVATTGVRGLSAEELKSAKFNGAEVKTLEGNTISAAQGQQFASSGGLKAIKFSLPKGGAK